MICDKLSALDDMIICRSCGGMSLCWRCFCHSHNGHEMQQLQNHMQNQVKQLGQWMDDKLPVLQSLALFETTIFNDCKALLDQAQAEQLKLGGKCKLFENKLGHYIDLSENELNASNGYKFDFASLEQQLQSIQDEHKQSITKRKELVAAMSKMLLSGDDDVSDVDKICMTETGFLLTDSQYLEFYSPSSNTTQLIDIEMQKRSGFVLEVLSDGRTMVAGGKSVSTQSSPTLIIGLVSKRVMQGPPMITGRRFAASAMIGGEMYVSGGRDQGGYNKLSSCEVFRNEQWIPIANMKVPHWGHALVALDGFMYAIGGLNDAGGMFTVERYSPETNSWQLVSPLSEPRIYFSAAAFNGYIYVAGGGSDGINSCERYCPNQNQWETVAPMNKRRQFFSLLPFGGKLYALGGDEEMTVESYNAEKNEWKIEDITLKTRWPKAVVLDYHPNEARKGS